MSKTTRPNVEYRVTDAELRSRMRRHVEQAGLSEEEVAVRAGCDRSEVSRILHDANHDLTVTDLAVLMGAIEAPVSALFELVTPDSESKPPVPVHLMWTDDHGVEWALCGKFFYGNEQVARDCFRRMKELEARNRPLVPCTDCESEKARLGL